MVKYAAVITLFSVAVLCAVATLSIVQVSKHLSNTLMKFNDEIDETHRLTLEAALTAMEARKASAKESAYLDIWNAEISKTLGNVNEVLHTANATINGLGTVTTAATSTLETTQETVRNLQAPIASADQALTAATASIKDLDKILADPQLTQMIAHTNSTMQHVDGTTADVQQAVHSYLHPTWPQRILGWVKTGVVTVGQAIF